MLALSRLVVVPGEPQNVASMLIGAVLRELRRGKRYDTLITYADQSAGHTGAVYRAANATPMGTTGRASYWVDADGARVCAKAARTRTSDEMRVLGYARRISPGKYVFLWRIA